MDDIVRAAMAKWPRVPACYGWLGLDARGDWYLRDDAAQAAGAFQARDRWPLAKGSRLQHDGLIAFIGRNYGCDSQGCWFFQNGPQRVFVELALAPWIWRLTGDGQGWCAHTGQAVTLDALWVDEDGLLYGSAACGLGVVHSADMLGAATWLERQGAEPVPVQRADMPTRFRYVLSPHQTPR